MKLAAFIAGRYLFAKKSHNVINIISAISTIGMVIGTAALIIVLSIYNGFDSLVKDMMGNVEPDLLIKPATGKVFVPEGEVYDWIYDQTEVESMCSVLCESVFVNYDGRQAFVKAKGIDEIYMEISPLAEHLRTGEWNFYRGEVPLASVGAGVAYEMGINPRFVSPLELYFPSRTRNVSVSNPLAAVESVKLWPGSIFSINNTVDAEYIFLPIEKMRELLEYDDEVSAVEIRVVPGTSTGEIKRLKNKIAGQLGPEYTVSDRFRQNESLYKMLKYEKLAIYMILIFIIIIIAFNIYGSLSMLIIEKKDDIRTLRNIGATDLLIRRIFTLEGWFISLVGLAGGLVIGVGFSLLQEHFGFIKMPGNFIVSAYPVIISWTDILLTVIAVAIIGYLIALLPVLSFYRKEKRHV